jgi:hypothetical protein
LAAGRDPPSFDQFAGGCWAAGAVFENLKSSCFLLLLEKLWSIFDTLESDQLADAIFRHTQSRQFAAGHFFDTPKADQLVGIR